MFTLVPKQITQSPDGMLWSDAVTSTGIMVLRGEITPPATVGITSNSVANPTVILTATPHLLADGDEVTIAGVAGSTPSINGVHTANVIDATHFSIPVAVTVGGTGGTVQQTYAAVAEVTEVTPGGMSRNKVDTTTHNDGSESHVLGILRQTDPGLKVNYVGTAPTHVAIVADIVQNRKANWMVRYPSGLKRSGQGYVQAFAFDGAPVDGKQGATITLTWAGPVTETAA